MSYGFIANNAPNGLCLNTFGFLYPLSGIWDEVNPSVVTAWLDCSPVVSTAWTEYNPTAAATWTEVTLV